MKLNIDLQTNHCELITKDITEVSDSGKGYLPESSTLTSINQFRYSDTISLHIFTYNKVDSNNNEIYLEFHKHGSTPEFQIDMFKHDGYVVYNYIVIPTKEWVDAHPNEVSKYELGVFYSDGTRLYKKDQYFEGEVQISDILAVDDFVNSTVSRVDTDIVVICNLKDCYLYYCNQIINNKLTICYSKNQNKDLLYKRDLVWMSLNIIDFLSEKQEFMAAQELIERLFNCTGLCISKKILGNDCGCT